MRFPGRVLSVILPAVSIMTMAGDGAAAPVGAPRCKELSEGLLKGVLTTTSKVQAVDGACVFDKVRIKTGTRQIWSVETLRVAGLVGWDPETSPFPPRLRVEAEGILFSPEIDSARIRYQLSLTQKPFDARLDFEWDSAKELLHLREIALESPWLGHVSLAMDAILPEGKLPRMSDLGRVKVSHLGLVLDNRIVLEAMLMPTLLGLVPEDKDPAVEIPEAQMRVERDWKKLPDTVLDAESRDALIRFTRDFPHPSGHFEFDLRFPEPTALEALKGPRKGGAPLDRTRIQAQYVRQAPAP